MGNIEVFKKHLREKRAVKIISGIDNYNLELVKKVAIAAQSGLASAIDVAASEDVIKTAKENTKLAIFASSINPFSLAKAVKAGADAVEIGNYEAMYKKNKSLTVQEVYDITLETMSILQGKNVFTCVTIPANATIVEQISLAKQLEILGVDLIQTEGRVKNQQSKTGLIELAEDTIKNTTEIAKYVSTPIMTASGLTPHSVPMAMTAGASAVGVGSCVNKLGTQVAMTTMVRSIVGSIAFRNPVMRDIVATSRGFASSSL